jgi:hypothetical protein
MVWCQLSFVIAIVLVGSLVVFPCRYLYTLVYVMQASALIHVIIAGRNILGHALPLLLKIPMPSPIMIPIGIPLRGNI